MPQKVKEYGNEKHNEKSSQKSTMTFFLMSLATSSKFLPTRTLTGFLSQSSGISCDIKCGFSLPSRYCCVNSMISSFLISLNSGLNFVISSSKLISRKAGTSSFFKPKNSRMRALSSTSVLIMTKRTYNWWVKHYDVFISSTCFSAL